MGNLRFGLLPVFSLVAVVATYTLNRMNDSSKKEAFRNAFFGGGIFVVYAIVDYFLLGVNFN
jgi:hypothetical protein